MTSLWHLSLGATPLLDCHLNHLHTHRYVVVPDWISVAQTARLQSDAVTVAEHAGFDSCIGHNEHTQYDTSVRHSRQCSLYPPPSNAVGSVSTRDNIIAAVNVLRDELQDSALMALPHLEAYETELNYLCYPDTGHYKRHLDTPYRNEGWVCKGRTASNGGSFGGARTRRVVSFILYLNRDWDAKNGGALRIFPAHERGDGSTASQQTGHTVDVLPEGGTLVLLMSGDVEHLVRETRCPRQCLVGWFREYESGQRVPDLDALSLRTWGVAQRHTDTDASGDA